MKGKLIIIEGTDCSGKETQTKLLIEHLKKNNEKVCNFCFPRYDTPTGKIIGGPYLGKEYICDSWFKEGAANVDAKVASLYFAADRLYNINAIKEKLNDGYTVILDRYVESNMAHQGGKIDDKEKRIEMYHFLEKLEFDLLGLPRPDAVIFLYMPVEIAKSLRQNREEKLDEHEKDDHHLICAQNAYLELSELFGFRRIDCFKNSIVKSIDDISKEVLDTYYSL